VEVRTWTYGKMDCALEIYDAMDDGSVSMLMVVGDCRRSQESQFDASRSCFGYKGCVSKDTSESVLLVTACCLC